MKRPDFERTCECGYFLCTRCGTPWYPMEIDREDEGRCPECDGWLLQPALTRLADSAEKAGTWASIRNILRFEDEVPENLNEESEQLRLAAKNLLSLAHEALEYVDKVNEQLAAKPA